MKPKHKLPEFFSISWSFLESFQFNSGKMIHSTVITNFITD